MQKQFRYLGVTIGDRMSRNKAWENVIDKLRSRLSKWKVKTLSIGGRLTLLKSVLGASPIYSMSIFKVPRGVLKIMEAIRSRFFNGIGQGETKFTCIAWNKVLASKERGGLGLTLEAIAKNELANGIDTASGYDRPYRNFIDDKYLLLLRSYEVAENSIPINSLHIRNGAARRDCLPMGQSDGIGVLILRPRICPICHGNSKED
ncbi:hypothetical protein Tco_0881707 [Tanacetum coccineum]